MLPWTPADGQDEFSVALNGKKCISGTSGRKRKTGLPIAPTEVLEILVPYGTSLLDHDGQPYFSRWLVPSVGGSASCGGEVTEAARRCVSTRTGSLMGVGCTTDWKKLGVVRLHRISVGNLAGNTPCGWGWRKY